MSAQNQSGPSVYSFSIDVEVSSVEKLLAAARERLVASGYEEDEASLILFHKDGSVNVEACIVQVLDPGDSPSGLQIIDSSASHENQYPSERG